MSQTANQKSTRDGRPLSFWDIESLANIFMFAMYFPASKMLSSDKDDPKDWMVFFYLFDGMTLTLELQDLIVKRVFEKNTRLDPEKTEIRFMDLSKESTNRLILDWFSVSNKRAFGKDVENDFYQLVKNQHTDLDASLIFPYVIGYNTQNYDCVMMASYFNETWGFAGPNRVAHFMPTKAETMRRFNNILFNGYRDNMKDALNELEKNIFENMLRTGIYIDAAKVNDKVYKMPLKRIMGMMGMDIFEDDVVKGDAPVTEPDKIADLFAYNASDCIKLSILFEHPAYAAQFQLKKGLLDAYPDIVFKTEEGRRSVRVNRMKADDTSAKFAQRVLCPDGWLKDIPAVSFEYPKGSGRNVLQETRDWAAEKFKDHPEVMEKYLGPIFDWYGAIEGRNYDDSEHYEQAYLFDAKDPAKISDIPMPCTSVPYFNADGTPSRTYVNFGIGGIHGAEYNQDLYLADVRAYEDRMGEILAFLAHFTEDELKALKPTVEINGVKYKRSDYITLSKDKATGAVIVKPKYPKPVELFTKIKSSGNWQLNKRYVWCSDDEVDHEDFTSYYPCLLMNMRAYENPALGEDRYVQQFHNKGTFGKYMKDQSRPKSERDFYKTMREGTKLILNSASGASDTAYDNPIRMNNVIISMRLIGQMFTWRIGQAQTLEGFKITSTNTDGLYAVCNDSNRDRCRQILEREAKDIGVDIEPEEMRLVSKDANNRIEVSLKGKLLSASGGDTACWDGPVPNKALSHPALIDRLLVDYMIQYGVNAPFDEVKAAEILDGYKKTLSPFKLLMLYQQIINSMEGSVRYIFGLVDGKVRTFQHNNRIFAIRKEGAHLYIANGQNRGSGHDDVADQVLRAYGIDPDRYANTRVIKISRIDPDQNMFIYNHALDELPEPIARSLIDNLDDGYYIDLLRNAYANWCNVAAHNDGDDGDAEE